MEKLKLIYSSSIASSFAIVFVTLVTIVAEFNAPLKNWLKALSGHHWTSKGILSLVLYAVVLFALYFTTKNVDAKRIKSALSAMIGITVLGSLTLFIFFTGHHLGWY